MDGLRKPVGDQPAGVYWFRRALVIIAVGLVVGGLWWLIASLGSGGGGEAEAAPDSTTSPAPEESDSAAAADPSRPCTPEDLTVSAAASPTNVNVGSMPAFDVSIEQTGATPCKLTTADEGTAMLVRSGSDVYYESAWCPDVPLFTSSEWILQPGDREAVQATWTGQRYNDACESGTVAPAGYYIAEISIAGASAGETRFQIVE